MFCQNQSSKLDVAAVRGSAYKGRTASPYTNRPTYWNLPRPLPHVCGGQPNRIMRAGWCLPKPDLNLGWVYIFTHLGGISGSDHVPSLVLSGDRLRSQTVTRTIPVSVLVGGGGELNAKSRMVRII